jgi:hypothetical protein
MWMIRTHACGKVENLFKMLWREGLTLTVSQGIFNQAIKQDAKSASCNEHNLEGLGVAGSRPHIRAQKTPSIGGSRIHDVSGVVPRQIVYTDQKAQK